MSEKRYYWLKLKDDFFKMKEIKKLRKLAGGDKFTIIYLKLLLLSLNNDGVLVYDGMEKDIAEQLSLEIDEALEDIRLTLVYLTQNGMMEQMSEEQYLLTKAQDMVGSETDAAQRMRKMRNIVTPALQGVTPPLHKRKEIDIDKKDIDDFFEECWKLYPRKEGKGVKPAPKKKAFELGDEFMRAIKRYAKSVEGKEKQFIKMGTTFWNGGYMDYLDKEYAEREKENTLLAEIAKFTYIGRNSYEEAKRESGLEFTEQQWENLFDNN